jgi:hypothetical protein
VEQLKTLTSDSSSPALTEWDVYTLVVDQLMLRDLKQAGRVLPEKRRRFLHSLALWLSQKDNSVASEVDFRALIQKEFKRELQRYDSSQRQAEVENLFDDLRRSGTLTRSVDPRRPGWRFSHNSLREFLLAEHLIESLERGHTVPTAVPITDAMRVFVRSQPEARLQGQGLQLARAWHNRATDRGVGQMLLLLWDGLLRLNEQAPQPVQAVLASVSPNARGLDSVGLSRLTLSTIQTPLALDEANFSGSELSDVTFAGAHLQGSDFTGCFLETVDLSDANLRGARFRDSVLVDVNLSRAALDGADFRGIHEDSSILVETSESGLIPEVLEARYALGFLNYAGAQTDPVDSYYTLRNHPRFPIVSKVCAKFSEHSPRQRLGVEQKGAAVRDIPFAKRFVAHLETCGFVEVLGGRSEVLYVTSSGREAVTLVASGSGLPKEIEDFLKAEA